eukprot:SAG11_NODE_4040_length_2092_cov_2.909684_3_plen_244_part_00
MFATGAVVYRCYKCLLYDGLTRSITDLPESGPQRYNFCLIIVDRHSQRVFHIHTWKTSKAEDVARQFYDEIVCKQDRGFPKEIISDRDSRFTAKFWRELQARSGTTIRFSTARQQSTNSAAERAVATIEEVMSMHLNYKQDNWVDLLPQLIHAINDSPSSVLGEQRTPLFVEFGFHPRRPIDFLDGVPRVQAVCPDRSVRNPGSRRQLSQEIPPFGPELKNVRRTTLNLLRIRENPSRSRIYI